MYLFNYLVSHFERLNTKFLFKRARERRHITLSWYANTTRKLFRVDAFLCIFVLVCIRLHQTYTLLYYIYMSSNNQSSLRGTVFRQRQMLLWMAALVAGAAVGLLHVAAIDGFMDFVASVYTRLFQLLAVPTIALAVVTTLATFGNRSDTGRIFRRAIVYTLLTTVSASLVGLVLYLAVSPEPLPPSLVAKGAGAVPDSLGTLSYSEHILSVVPSNILRPMLEGNVLSILLLSFAVGMALSRMPDSPARQTVVKWFSGMQELLFMLIRGLIWTLPAGIVAFSAQLTSQVSMGIAAASLGKYVAVILGGNVIQFFIVLPLFLLARGINPFRTLRCMVPAVLMALFTKSSAATLPVTMSSAEHRLGVSPKVARFVLPLCTTINMNGCAAFILVTSLFVMQNGGIELSPSMLCLWVLLSVVTAVGNAGVPMGCYFLTLSLMSGTGAPVGIMGIILPIYTIIDMIETAENVWSDSCVCAMTARDVTPSDDEAPA